ncbi:hypothetical protein GGX14DRAFT_608769 [Mycena pura]|uniref:Uncharacterized protein n=1 Tax=Mycena pura TaxID=153505 RepID=A0AAD6XVQ7_9AGAR|nr:hypothetical protein GGX14DRAFT_608769 [Mycena pura]
MGATQDGILGAKTSVPEGDSQSQTQTNAEGDSQSQTQTNAEGDSQSQTQTNAEGDSQSQAETNVEGADSQSQAQTNSDSPPRPPTVPPPAGSLISTPPPQATSPVLRPTTAAVSDPPAASSTESPPFSVGPAVPMKSATAGASDPPFPSQANPNAASESSPAFITASVAPSQATPSNSSTQAATSSASGSKHFPVLVWVLVPALVITALVAGFVAYRCRRRLMRTRVQPPQDELCGNGGITGPSELYPYNQSTSQSSISSRVPDEKHHLCPDVEPSAAEAPNESDHAAAGAAPLMRAPTFATVDLPLCPPPYDWSWLPAPAPLQAAGPGAVTSRPFPRLQSAL